MFSNEYTAQQSLFSHGPFVVWCSEPLSDTYKVYPMSYKVVNTETNVLEFETLSKASAMMYCIQAEATERHIFEAKSNEDTKQSSGITTLLN